MSKRVTTTPFLKINILRVIGKTVWALIGQVMINSEKKKKSKLLLVVLQKKINWSLKTLNTNIVSFVILSTVEIGHPWRQRWGQLLLKVMNYITITLHFLHYHYSLFRKVIITITITLEM